MRDLGDISVGRPNLGDMMPVYIYRLMEVAMFDVLNKEFGKEKSDELFRQAGYMAGKSFCERYLNKSLPFNDFISQLQSELKNNKIGILRIEKADLSKDEFVLCIYEDLDCSGMPVTDETVCVYDEGFISGILNYYTGEKFEVKEIDCWGTGERVCRFKALKN